MPPLRLLAIAVLVAFGMHSVDARMVLSADLDWKFMFIATTSVNCSMDTFPLDLGGVTCKGLTGFPYNRLQTDDSEGCREACCGDDSCAIWQWCPEGATSCDGPNCWTGGLESLGNCDTRSSDMQGGGRDEVPPPSPSPPPSGTLCNETMCAIDFDDSDWRDINVPHDFVVEGNFSLDASKSHGYLPFGIGYYRKHFFLPAEAEGQDIVVRFDGVMVECEVYLNGILLGSHSGGYTPFRFNVSSIESAVINFGGSVENVLAIRVDATNPESSSWWYDGGGLYRHVWVDAIDPRAHIGINGVYAPAHLTGPITAQTALRPASANAILGATVDVESTSGAVGVSVECSVFKQSSNGGVAGGDPVARATVVVGDMTKGDATTASFALDMPGAKLWSVEHPTLYLLVAMVTVSDGDGNEVISDVVNTTFGVRTIRFDSDLGFFLNDQPVKIKGTANHQDFAGLGTAVPDSLQEFRIKKLQSIGGNGWRTAHNMHTEAVLDHADRLGMLVWDENHANGMLAEAEELVRRDRNHPSVIVWSICNEILCDSGDGEKGTNSLADAAAIKGAYEKWDPLGGRPTSANQNLWVYNDSVLDLLGYDYATESYDAFHDSTPNYPAISSESSSAVSDRGEYASNKTLGYVSGYGDEVAGSWAASPEQAWGGVGEPDNQGILTRAFVSGGWTWTGFDYKGEPTPYNWPDVNSHFGIFDIAAFEKDRAFWYKAWWLERGAGDAPALYVFPHWNWNDSATLAAFNTHLATCAGRCRLGADGGAVVDVWAFSDAAEVELLLNGESLGRQAMPQYAHVAWEVPYAAGTLEGRAFAAAGDAEPATTFSVATTKAPAALRASLKDGVGASGIAADGSDVALVQVEVVDEDGRLVPEHGPVHVAFAFAGDSGDGVAMIDGTGSGDPADHTPDKASTRPAYHGLVLGVVRAKSAAAGSSVGTDVEITVSADGLASSSVTVAIVASTFPHQRI